MRYTAVLGGEERIVEVTPREGGYRVAIGEKSLDVDAAHLHGAAVSLIVGTRSYRCDIEARKDGQLAVLVNESVVPLEMLDEKKLRLRRAAGKFSLEGPQRIDAPMPGKVVRVLVKLGDEVQEGQGLVVVEAMKMENELKSPKPGKVAELHAVEGAAVESGVKLVVIV
jgi:biotin carboxyl carrier protein